jgi:hypothetical protein
MQGTARTAVADVALTEKALGSKEGSYSKRFQNFLAATYDEFLSLPLLLLRAGGLQP